MTTLVLAGGLGTRLRPVVGNVPKVLASIGGRPFLYNILQYLHNQSQCDVVLCTGFEADQVAAYSGDGFQWGIRIRYSSEAEPLGTGGAIKHAQPLINSDPFLVLNADSLVNVDLSSLLGLHSQNRAKITIALTPVSDSSRFGSVELDKHGAVSAFGEKLKSGPGLINAGIYSIDRAVLDVIPAGRSVSLEREVFPHFLGKGMYGMVVRGPFIDIGTPEAYERAQSFFAGSSENA